MITTAPMSSMIAIVTSNSLSDGGARGPSSASTPMAKAMSVAAGIAQPRSKMRVGSGDGKIDQGRDRHSGGGGEDRQPPLGVGRKTPLIPFALHFQPDEQEEDRHQPVGDQRVDAQRADPRLEQRMIVVGQRRVGGDQRSGGSGNQKQAGDALGLLGRSKRIGHPPGLAARPGQDHQNRSATARGLQAPPLRH